MTLDRRLESASAEQRIGVLRVSMPRFSEKCRWCTRPLFAHTDEQRDVCEHQFERAKNRQLEWEARYK